MGAFKERIIAISQRYQARMSGVSPDGSAPRGRPPHSSGQRIRQFRRRTALVCRRLRYFGRSWPVQVFIEGRLTISGAGTIRLGVGVRLNDSVWLNAESGGILTVGPRTAIGRFSHLTAAGQVTLGADVLLSPGVLIMDHSHGTPGSAVAYLGQPLHTRGAVHIEDGCWLGAYACILSGDEDLVIGAGSIIGAGAIVTRSVPARSVVVGPTAGPIVRRVRSLDIQGERE